MKKVFFVFAAVMVCLAVLLPFASKTPDGLETLTENHATQHQPYWSGMFADYSAALGNPYFSTLVAGVVGVGLVVGASLALSLTVKKNRSEPTEN